MDTLHLVTPREVCKMNGVREDWRLVSGGGRLRREVPRQDPVTEGSFRRVDLRHRGPHWGEQRHQRPVHVHRSPPRRVPLPPNEETEVVEGPVDVGDVDHESRGPVSVPLFLV